MLDTMVFQTGEKLRLDLTRFDILDVVKEVCQESLSGAQCNIVGSSVQGWWSREAMKRALENLVSNAAKYGISKKPIRIKIDEEHKNLTLSVHNEGIPISPEDQELVFQVFRRTKDAKAGKKQGWGVGLPYVRAAVESHGGTITIDSTLERGTTFLITMPVDARPFQDAPVST